MQTATETERKYDVPEGFTLPRLPGAGEAETHELDATYYDTDDLRLLRGQRTLRRRTGGTDAGWHLKTPGAGSDRTEHRLPDEGDDVPDELVGEVRAIVRDRPLRPVARLRTRRVETPLCDDDGRTLALIAQDQVTAESDGAEQHWQEVEVELVDGDAGLLESVERELLAAGATAAAGPSKLARALGDRLATPAAGKSKTKINPILRYAREQRDAITAHDPGVRHGDAESVHKMRVATRRLRSVLRTYRRSFDPDLRGTVGPELKWLAGQLGAVRDGQVLERKLLAAVDDAGPEFGAVAQRVRDHLDATVTAAQQTLRRDLDSERYLRLLDAIDDLVAPATGERKPARRARTALAKADRRLDDALASGRDESLHAARKAYKRARYAVEVFEPSGGKPAGKLIKRLTALQDVLGAHQDSVVARQTLRELAGDGDEAFRFGILYARHEQVGRDTLDGLRPTVRASRKRKVRAWLG